MGPLPHISPAAAFSHEEPPFGVGGEHSCCRRLRTRCFRKFSNILGVLVLGGMQVRERATSRALSVRIIFVISRLLSNPYVASRGLHRYCTTDAAEQQSICDAIRAARKPREHHHKRKLWLDECPARCSSRLTRKYPQNGDVSVPSNTLTEIVPHQRVGGIESKHPPAESFLTGTKLLCSLAPNTECCMHEEQRFHTLVAQTATLIPTQTNDDYKAATPASVLTSTSCIACDSHPWQVPWFRQTVAVVRGCAPRRHSKEDASPVGAVDFNLQHGGGTQTNNLYTTGGTHGDHHGQ